jgi:hypothetical protein
MLLVQNGIMSSVPRLGLLPPYRRPEAGGRRPEAGGRRPEAGGRTRRGEGGTGGAEREN